MGSHWCAGSHRGGTMSMKKGTAVMVEQGGVMLCSLAANQNEAGTHKSLTKHFVHDILYIFL